MVGVKVTLVITWCYFGYFGDHMDISEEDGLLAAIKVFSDSTEQWRPMTSSKEHSLVLTYVRSILITVRV